ncbi:MAG: hypothetical protein V7K65_22410 [Nostoc sp.]
MAIAGQNEINRLERAIAFLMWRRQSRFHQRSDRTKTGIPPTYQLMTSLNLNESEGSIRLFQVMKAICQLENFQMRSP